MFKVLLRVTVHYSGDRAWIDFEREVELPVAYPGLMLYGFFGGPESFSEDEIERVGVDGPGGNLIVDLKPHRYLSEGRAEILDSLKDEEVGFYDGWAITSERDLRNPSGLPSGETNGVQQSSDMH